MTIECGTSSALWGCQHAPIRPQPASAQIPAAKVRTLPPHPIATTSASDFSYTLTTRFQEPVFLQEPVFPEPVRLGK